VAGLVRVNICRQICARSRESSFRPDRIIPCSTAPAGRNDTGLLARQGEVCVRRAGMDR
jgi:hypothetical protein